MSKEDSKFFVALYPEMARCFGSITRAIYLQNFIHWSDKGKRKDGFIYKKKEDIEKETTLTRYQQDSCRKYFEKKGILETKLLKANGVPTLHYRVKNRNVRNLLNQS
ncbi:hypothetical protein ES703_40455 [subsurface metagenome]